MNNENQALGNKIRKTRLSKSMTLATFARKIGKTTSYLSQIKRGLASPSIMALIEISKTLNVPIFYFLVDDGKHRAVVRKNERKVLQFPRSHLTFELLSPDLSKQIEMIKIQMKPGPSICTVPLPHQGEECTFVLEGKMEIQIGDECFILEKGDTIYYIAGIPHKITSIGKEDLVAISAITPSNF